MCDCNLDCSQKTGMTVLKKNQLLHTFPTLTKRFDPEDFVADIPEDDEADVDDIIMERTKEREKEILKQHKALFALEIGEGMVRVEDAACPYCLVTLKTPPGRKRKCPSCKQVMYVRTLPFDNNDPNHLKHRVAVTEKKANEIDEAWEKVNGEYEINSERRTLFHQAVAELRESIEREPSEQEIEYFILTKNAKVHMQRKTIDSYCTTIEYLARHLWEQEQYEEAIPWFLQVMYLKIHAQKSSLAFRQGSLHPLTMRVILQPVHIIFERFDFKPDELKETFLLMASELNTKLGCGLDPEKAWNTIKEDIPYAK